MTVNQRYAQYNTDEAAQELRRRAPLVAIWDDHELANDAFSEGAQNHQEVCEGSNCNENEGDFTDRMNSAAKVIQYKHKNNTYNQQKPTLIEVFVCTNLRMFVLAGLSGVDANQEWTFLSGHWCHKRSRHHSDHRVGQAGHNCCF